jgi:ankyrin repeat protein
MLRDLFNKLSDKIIGLSVERRNEKLVEAAIDGKVQDCKALLAAGADVNTGEEGNLRGSALIQAASAGKAGVLPILLEAGANIDARNYSQRGALHEAVWHGHEEAALVLLQAGANPNSVDRSGDSPLHSALQFDHRKMAVALAASGADLTLPGKEDKGETLRAELSRKGWTDVVEAADRHVEERAAAAARAEAEAIRKKAELAAAIEASPILQHTLNLNQPFVLRKRPPGQ